MITHTISAPADAGAAWRVPSIRPAAAFRCPPTLKVRVS